MIATGALACGRIGFDDGEVQPLLIELDVEPRVALTDGSSCVLRESGTLYCWGANYGGELAVGDYEPRDTPQQVGAAGVWRRITAGANHLCGVQADGDVYCWGSNAGGSELGVGDYLDRLVPTRVAVPGTAIAIASCASTTHALTTTGTRWGWGDNRGDGTSGIGSNIGPILIPVPALGADWTAITMGWDRACALDADRELWCWGGSSIGTGDSATYFEPMPIAAGARWLAISAETHTCGIQADDSLWCWGNNARGAVGDGTTMEALAPIRVAVNDAWRAVGTGVDVTCAIRSDGSLWCTGANAQGQLGVGDRIDRNALTEVMPGSRWARVDISPFLHACGVQEDGRVYCWGEGALGELGQGADRTDHLTPVAVDVPL